MIILRNNYYSDPYPLKTIPENYNIPTHIRKYIHESTKSGSIPVERMENYYRFSSLRPKIAKAPAPKPRPYIKRSVHFSNTEY